MELQPRSNAGGNGSSMSNGNGAGKSLRGFASMDKEKQKAIASKGGRAAHEKGTAHEFDSSEASMAAKRGHQKGTAHEFTSDEARVAGRKGGLARAAKRQRPNADEGKGNGQMDNNASEARMEASESVSNPT